MKSSIWPYLLVAAVGLCIGIPLFLFNPWLLEDLHSQSYVWFLDFSKTIFQPQSAYYSESILLPLLARMLGASKTLIAYKLFCSLLTICILPITAIFALTYLQSVCKTLIFIVLFGFSFQYFQFYILGFPDPLTILLLVLVVFQKRFGAIFGLLILAMLSHFSMAALGAVGLAFMFYLSPSASLSYTRKSAGAVIIAIAFGKVLLVTWYAVFHYQLVSRLDWVLGKGYTFFLGRYETDVIGFWLTPGIFFLITYFLVTAYFLMQKRYAFMASALLALAISYFALFCTIDGLRVFSVIIAAPYTYLLLSFIQSLSICKTAD